MWFGMDVSYCLLLLLLVVHQAGTVAACLGNLHAILVAQLIGLLHELLHLLHDHLVLLLILLLVRISGLLLLLRLLVDGWEIGRLLLWLLRGLIPWVGDVSAARRLAPALLCLTGSLF